MILVFSLAFTPILASCTKIGDDAADGSAGNGTKAGTAARSSSKVTTSSAATAAKTAVTTAKASVTTGITAAQATAAGTSPDSSDIAETEETDNSAGTVLDEESFEDVEVSLTGKIGEMNIDLGGKTIVYSTYANYELPSDKADSYGPEHVILYKRIEAAQEKYNFKVEYKYLPALNATTFLNAFLKDSLAGIKFADVIHFASSACFPMLAEQKMILSLDDYVDYELPIIKNNSLLYKGTLYKGKHYGTGWRYYSVGNVMAYNRTLIDREGQPDILGLVENNTWTWDVFLEIAKNCTRDINADGIIDQYGVVCATQLQFYYNMLNSNGVTGVEFSSGGKARVNLDTPQGIRALQFISDLNFVHKVFAQNIALYNQQNAALIALNGAGGNSPHIKLGIESIMIPNPMGPDMSKYANIGTSHTHCVTALCESPREVARIWTEASIIWTEELEPIPELLKVQLEKYPYDWKWSTSNTARYISSEREYISVIKELFKVCETDFNRGYPNLPTIINSNIITPLFTGQKSVSQVLDTVKPMMQDILDQYN